MLKKLLLLSTVSTLFAEGAGGSAPNSLYIQASYVPVSTEGYFADDSEVIKGPTNYEKHGLSLYAKHGLWDESLSLIGNFGFRSHKIDGVGDNTGLEDMSLKLDWLLAMEKWTTPLEFIILLRVSILN